MDADAADGNVVQRQCLLLRRTAPDAADVGLGRWQLQPEILAPLQAQHVRGDRYGESGVTVERDLAPLLRGELDSHTVDVRGEGALLGLQEGLIHFVAAANVEVQQPFVFGDVEQNGEEALPPFLE